MTGGVPDLVGGTDPKNLVKHAECQLVKMNLDKKFASVLLVKILAVLQKNGAENACSVKQEAKRRFRL